MRRRHRKRTKTEAGLNMSRDKLIWIVAGFMLVLIFGMIWLQDIEKKGTETTPTPTPTPAKAVTTPTADIGVRSTDDYSAAAMSKRCAVTEPEITRIADKYVREINGQIK